MMVESIQIKGARQHNLKNVDVEIPRGKLVVITGPSGSGKSSLAFHTLYAEGQRRYVESLSVYARQFLDQLEKPDVDSITGLSPAIAIEQRGGGVNPRSTIATATEIHDYLRILYATAGVPHDPKTGERLEKATSADVTNALMAQPEGSQLILLSPVSLKNVKGDEQVASFIADLQRQGFVRLRIKGEMVELEEAQASWPKRLKECEVVIDRLVVKEKSRSRIADSVETALRVCDEEIRAIVRADRDAEWESLSFVTSFRNVDTGFVMPDLTPGLFSFNSHTGACPACHGLGTEMFCDKQLLVPDPRKTLNEGGVQGPWTKSSNAGKKGWNQRQLEAVAHYFKVDFDTPFSKLPDDYKEALFYGTGDEKIEVEWEKEGIIIPWKKKFEGLCRQIERLNRETKSESVKRSTGNFMRSQRCRVCEGKRLKPEVLGVKIYSRKKNCAGIGIQDFCHLSIREARQWLETLQLSDEVHQVCGSVQAEVIKRLSFLEDVGLHYLGLDRVSSTLSGGESQRIRLATQLGAGLAGVLYVLDEPSIGLHPSDNDRLIGALTRLRDLGNTVVVVEHDEEMMLAADLIIDVGPKAGVDGGEIIAVATPKEIVKIKSSPTGQWLSGKMVSRNEEVARRSKSEMLEWIRLKGIRENNLQDITVEIPLGTFTCITGPSGSGKSTLVNRILKPALRRQIHRVGDFPGDFDELSGADQITRVVVVDQKPIGKSPRSNPATYTGAMDLLRDIYAKLPLSKERGYKAGRFSFNVKGGRCEKCQGGGLLRIDMHFLPDVFIKCDSCDGHRYNRETLEVTYRGHSIAQVLSMTASEALGLFEKVPKLAQILRALNDVGLGYLRLGQAANTLSGGEAQRVKLAAELSKTSHGHVLYILDEPTTGLHFADVDLLMACLFRLREAGHSLVVIEHHLDVIKRSDYVIDLGPGGGSEGGELVAAGSPAEIQKVKKSLTGKWLKKSS